MVGDKLTAKTVYTQTVDVAHNFFILSKEFCTQHL